LGWQNSLEIIIYLTLRNYYADNAEKVTSRQKGVIGF